jgi:hypothetical protein
MFSSRDAFENDFCPVREELLGEMYRASANGLPALVDSVSSDVRAMLALFCYRRSHLHSLARARIDPVGRAGRHHALYPLARAGGACRAVVVLRQPQADHAFDQAVVHLCTDRGRARRRRCCGIRDRVISPPVAAARASAQHRQTVPPPRHRAFGISGQAGAADLGPHLVDDARRRHADLARQCRAPIAVAAHA